MNDLHPHWQTTEDEQPVPIRFESASNESHMPVKPASANRAPAAFFGIAVILIAGFFAFGGVNLLPAQVSTETVVIISDTGVVPAEFTVTPGQRITWTNISSIPQILTSKTLKDASGKPFVTPAVFPNSQVSFDIPSSTPNGTYDFESNTSPNVKGTITVGSPSAVVQSSSASSVFSVASVQSSTAPIVNVVSSASSSSRQESSSSSATVQSQASIASTSNTTGIPVNPYTVSNTLAGTVTKGFTQTAAVTTHRPVAQPESGMGAWLTVLTGITALVIVMKRASIRA